MNLVPIFAKANKAEDRKSSAGVEYSLKSTKEAAGKHRELALEAICKQDVLLVLGNESRGGQHQNEIESLFAKNISSSGRNDQKMIQASIPMKAQVESLNVGVAAAIILQDILFRKRKK